MDDKKGKIKICVSGASDAHYLNLEIMEIAKELGREISRQNAVLTTGSTTGFPLWAAMGNKEEKGISFGISPASSEKEHKEVYRLPTEYMDIIIYTGFGFAGGNLLLTRSSDAVLVGPGGIGAINEFTIAVEDDKPIGILEGDWETDEVIKNILKKSHRENTKIVFDSNPKVLVQKIIDLVKKS